MRFLVANNNKATSASTSFDEEDVILAPLTAGTVARGTTTTTATTMNSATTDMLFMGTNTNTKRGNNSIATSVRHKRRKRTKWLRVAAIVVSAAAVIAVQRRVVRTQTRAVLVDSDIDAAGATVKNSSTASTIVHVHDHYYDDDNDDHDDHDDDDSSNDSGDDADEPRPFQPLYPAEEKNGDRTSVQGVSGPKVAWLMSFPNSGTSFTLVNTRSVTQQRTAGNYCDAGSTIPPSIYNKTFDELPAPHFIKKYETYHTPSKYILTKTHCGGRCQGCKAKDYVIPHSHLQEFEDECLKLCLGREPSTGTQFHDYYSMDLVKKAVHLFRHPLHNVISRFHLHHKHAVQHDDMEQLERHPKTIDGYQQYCKDMDHSAKLWKQDRRAYGSSLWRLAREVPCHADLYRYVQWHNLAFDMVQRRQHQDEEQMGNHNTNDINTTSITTHILHYEDYHTNFNETVSSLLDFLEQEWVGQAKDFYWSDYSDYYTPHATVAARKFIKSLASDATWAQVKRYFPRTHHHTQEQEQQQQDTINNTTSTDDDDNE
jgi:hypothetical protein